MKDSRGITIIGTIELHGDDTVSVLAVAFRSWILKLWNVTALHEEPHTANLEASVPIIALAFTPDRSRLLSGTTSGTLSIWEASNLALSHITRYDSTFAFIVFSPDGRMMATSRTEAFRAWDLADFHLGMPKNMLWGLTGVVASVEFSQDGQRSVTSSRDCGWCVWCTDDGREFVWLYEYPRPMPHSARVVVGWDRAMVKV